MINMLQTVINSQFNFRTLLQSTFGYINQSDEKILYVIKLINNQFVFRDSLIEIDTFCFVNQEKLQILSISVYRAAKKWVQWPVRSAQLFYLPKHNELLECQNTI